MKLLFIGDPHLRINKFSLATQFLSWVDSLILAQRPDVVVNLGDALDNHAVIRSEALNELMNHVYTVVDAGIPYVYLKGNHDQYTPKDSKYHALLPFKGRINNLFIVDEIVDLFGITFVPYLYDGSLFPKKTQSICVAHQSFLGADYGAQNAKEGVDADTVSADIIISGHIHKKHTLGKVVYVGSPYSQEASDVNQIKGISIFDTETLQFEFFQCPLPTWRAFQFELSATETIDELHKSLSSLLTDSKDHWVVELKGPKAEITAYLDSARYRKLIEAVNVRLKTVFTDKEKQRTTINAISMDQVISEFVNKIYTGSLPKETILSEANDVLEAVRLQGNL